MTLLISSMFPSLSPLF